MSRIQKKNPNLQQTNKNPSKFLCHLKNQKATTWIRDDDQQKHVVAQFRCWNCKDASTNSWEFSWKKLEYLRKEGEL